MANEDYRSALKNYLKLYKLTPENTTVLINLRTIYYKLGQKKNALKISNKILESQPDDADVIYDHVKILYDFKNYPDVIKYSDKLIEPLSGDATLWVMRAEAFSNMNKFDRALECWNRIIELESIHGLAAPEPLKSDTSETWENSEM
jgi:tetratricopeptide (TPR) repeat protein